MLRHRMQLIHCLAARDVMKKVILFSERRSKTARASVVNELNSKILLILFLIYMIIFLADILRESDL